MNRTREAARTLLSVVGVVVDAVVGVLRDEEPISNGGLFAIFVFGFVVGAVYL